MHTYKKRLAIIVCVCIVMCVSYIANAQQGPSGPLPPPSPPGQGPSGPLPSSGSAQIKFENPLSIGSNTISGFIQAVLEKIVIPIGGVVSVLFIIYAGFLFVTAQGSEDKLKSAKTALLNAIIGTLIILGSWTIAKVIETTLRDITGI